MGAIIMGMFFLVGLIIIVPIFFVTVVLKMIGIPYFLAFVIACIVVILPYFLMIIHDMDKEPKDLL